MQRTLIPSLDHIILVQIAALLWNQSDIRDKIAWFPFFSDEKLKQWQAIEDQVMVKVVHLSLPKDLERRVLGSVKPIGRQIFTWMEGHKNLYSGILNLPKEPCWTMHGLLDDKKTAVAVIQDKSFHIITRYKLACTYCLENDIKELWNEIPEDLKKLVFNSKYLREFELPTFLVSLWTHEIEGKLLAFHNEMEVWFWHIPVPHQRASPYKNAFEYSAHFGNKIAADFFLQKLTPREKEESLVWCIEYLPRYPSTNSLTRYYDVLCLLMSQMGEEHQLQVYLRYSRTMLEYLLDYPWQSFFVETANRVWGFLSAEDYDYLLNKIVLKVKEGFQDWNYRQLFGQFWRKSTIPYKRCVLDGCICGPLLTNLLHIKDIENISLLVHDATIVEREELVYYRIDVVATLMYNEGWNLLKILVEHCPSKEDIVGRFQKEFLERDLTSRAKEDIVEEKAILKKFVKSLNNILIHKPRFSSPGKVQWHKEEAKSDLDYDNIGYEVSERTH